MAQAQHFVKPSLTERIFNRLFAIAIGFGVGLGHNYVVEVRDGVVDARHARQRA